ncbi:MAG: ParB/RepB/Spo0J family partition protein [Bacilli bacterium]|nr:ParB/RepB/Spo0J family partition protein [Bacilli bacterium]MDD3895715.1 ParB/RepB/Spo0J family partition protein [Bacilli bacterium]MDD4407465.1 ParB/RepB/Spo0J family partition protein [Bacilli bacterium]
MNNNPTIQMISIEQIIPNRFQPRLTFDEQGINELSSSIKEHGIIQPLVLRKLGEKYEIIAGERRYKAATVAGLTEVPAIISSLDDNQSAEVALVENVQRKNLTSIEEAKSYQKILEKGYLNQEQLAKKLGVSQSTIANKLRLLNLTEEVQEALLNEKISERHARSLLQLTDAKTQIDMLNKVINERLTVRNLDSEIKNMINPENKLSSDNVTLEPIEPIEENSEKTINSLEESEDKIINNDDVNIEEIKNNAKDIIPNSKANIFNIFDQESYPSLENEKVNLSMNNIFDEEEDLEEETLEVKDFTPVAPTISEIRNNDERIKKNNLPTVIEAYHDLEEEIKEADYKITSEEFDFEDLYQIIIKIEKEVQEVNKN